jgi:hypothetical protein
MDAKLKAIQDEIQELTFKRGQDIFNAGKDRLAAAIDEAERPRDLLIVLLSEMGATATMTDLFCNYVESNGWMPEKELRAVRQGLERGSLVVQEAVLKHLGPFVAQDETDKSD